jgi:hypothetical protein
VHKDIFDKFRKLLLKKLPSYKIGSYKNRSCKIGSISDPFDLTRIEEFIIKHKEFIDKSTPGIIRSLDAIVEPTIIVKPLSLGGNFIETFAPIIILQKYDSDKELSLYFEHPLYIPNAMYVTVYGSSDYVKSLINKKINGKLLHDSTNVLFNIHLHADGVERGTKPYGGYGYGGSNLWFMGKGISKPTLPQRDIYECVVKWLGEQESLESFKQKLAAYTKIEEKNIEKLLKVKHSANEAAKEDQNFNLYIDRSKIAPEETKRYIKVTDSLSHKLLTMPHVLAASALTQTDLSMIRELRRLLMNKPPSQEEFRLALYAIANKNNDESKKIDAQKAFFGNIYKLLFDSTTGPRLSAFLFEVDVAEVAHLLDF